MSIFNSLVMVLALLAVLSRQQADNTAKGTVNFEGDFDSMHHTGSNPPPVQDQQQEEEEEEDGESYQEQQQDMLEFSEYMADFLPDQTFTFKLASNQLEQFMIWPSVEVEIIRGMFHSQVTDEDDLEGYVNLALYDNDQLVRNYKQQRLGIFNINHTQKDHRYMFKFENGKPTSEVYFSYEVVTKQKRENKQPKNESQIELVTRQFEKVNRLIVQQESEMGRLMGISQRHQERIDEYLSKVQWTLLLETLMISIGNIGTLLLLKRQLYAGYELLV